MKDVASAREAIRDDHGKLYVQIHALMAAAKRGDPPNVLGQLRKKIQNASPDLEDRFIDAAKRDLGVGE
ncbi:hypothetical protein A5662_11105 [Mycobacteriaceae bacterium 1482268.1]|nr:hypothetical protein A5662_11105 [Mycobacteriaceae bacterium 1482268.1]